LAPILCRCTSNSISGTYNNDTRKSELSKASGLETFFSSN